MPKSICATRRILGALIIVATSIVFMAGSALAHEHREVGEYQLEVGFLNEPAIVDEPNAMFLGVTKGAGNAGAPVDGLAGSLNAEIIYGAERMPLDVEPLTGQPGVYTANIIPTDTGAYTFRIFGSLEGLEIDESFTGGPETFVEVQSRQNMTFPRQVSPAGEIETMANDASDSASTALLLGLAGLIAGLLGTALGTVAFMKTRQSRPDTFGVAGGMTQDASD